VNGREGLPPQLDATPSEAERAEWRIEVNSPSGRAELSLARLGELPRVEMTAQLRCIEGWSTIVHWGGVRLLDALAATRIATRSGRGPDPDSAPDDLFQFVGLATPDGGYHVGLDVESALHPQTLLVDTMNGRPLTVGHGGPIRLVIPVKYGVKNIKRVGSIALSDTRPSDYWAQRGYDWYAGL
jgi:DMSO/TMAO reductase YedYZ molybdopterin-dependent catalytic subunit